MLQFSQVKVMSKTGSVFNSAVYNNLFLTLTIEMFIELEPEIKGKVFLIQKFYIA